VSVEGIGNAGNVDITSNFLSASNATISADTYGIGNAGSVNISARDRVEFDAGSRVFSEVNEQAVGKGGSINITTGALDVSNLSELGTRTFGRGDAGSVNISARERVSFDNGGRATSALFFSAEGKSGDINIAASQLSVNNNATLSANTFGIGNAGNVNISARERVSFDNGGRATSEAFFSSAGNGGSINITARELSLSNGARLTANTSGAGNAGNVRVNVTDSINISGNDSGLFSSTEFGALGMGGAIEVRSLHLRIADGGVLQARTQSDFNGGNISVNVSNLELTGGGQILTTATSVGNAGSINIDATDSVTISGGDRTYSARLAELFAELGEFDVPTEFLDFLFNTTGDASGIFANTGSNSIGSGGSIGLNTTNLNITDGGRISVNSQGTGNGGNLHLTATDSINLTQQASVLAGTESGSGGDITLQAGNLLLLRNNSNISAKAGNSANGGNISIDAPLVVAVPSEDSDIIATAVQGRGGIITIDTNSTFGLQRLPSLTSRSDINANSASGINGEVQINTPGIDPGQGLTTLPEELVNLSALVPQGCKPSGGESQLVVTGRGGLPPHPTQPLNGDTVLVNFQAPSLPQGTKKPLADKPLAVNPQPATPTSNPQLVEATAWVVNSHGQIELVANAPKLTPHNPWQPSTTCSKVN
jgi:large exoprotein involved in heme utilization and adhesion